MKAKKTLKIEVVYLIKENPGRAEIAGKLAPYILADPARCQHLHEQISLAFCGQPFFRDLNATHPKNRQRFRTYWDLHSRVAAREARLFNQFLRVFGIDPAHPNRAWLNDEGREQPAPNAQPHQPQQIPPGEDPEVLKIEEMMRKSRDKYSQEKERTAGQSKAGGKYTE